MTPAGECTCASVRPDLSRAVKVAGDESPLKTTESEKIDEWVADQMREPWPLSSSQLDVIRRTLGVRDGIAGSSDLALSG
jgi:hypothetical protein